MSKTVVDTNVLIALLNSGDDLNEKAEQLLGKLDREGGIFINPVIYSELSTYFQDRKKLDKFIEDTGIRVESISKESAFVAGEKFSEYLSNRPERLQCPECGSKTDAEYPDCGNSIKARQHIAPDFLIGSHAKVQGDRLASFDTGFHSNYFPELEIVPGEVK
ncbi:MAG: type II toxin-antitoxin system VapC family toxin [Candidatus Nanohaloarchaea archaeon]